MPSIQPLDEAVASAVRERVRQYLAGPVRSPLGESAALARLIQDVGEIARGDWMGVVREVLGWRQVPRGYTRCNVVHQVEEHLAQQRQVAMCSRKRRRGKTPRPNRGTEAEAT